MLRDKDWTESATKADGTDGRRSVSRFQYILNHVAGPVSTGRGKASHAAQMMMGKILTDVLYFPFPGQLYGHTHQDDFHLQILNATDEEASTKSFILIAPSISPIFHNNPAFRVLSLNTDKQALVDYDQYYLDLVIATGGILLSESFSQYIEFSIGLAF